MSTRFYIEKPDGTRDGPYDLAVMMKRIKAERIMPDTLVWVEGDEQPTAARNHPQLGPFFQREAMNILRGSSETTSTDALLKKAFSNGWQLVNVEIGLCIYAGVTALISFLLVIFAWNAFGIFALFVGFLFSMLMHGCLAGASLHIYHGQQLNNQFIKKELSKTFRAHVLFGLISFFLVVIGGALALVPGVLFYTMFAFTPYFIQDQRHSFFGALNASQRLVAKNGTNFFSAVFTLSALQLVGLFLMLPMMITTPLISAALAHLYEHQKS